MGFNPVDIDYIRLAHEDRLGVGRVEEIEVQGEDISGYSGVRDYFSWRNV